jgi:hypothetical protein
MIPEEGDKEKKKTPIPVLQLVLVELSSLTTELITRLTKDKRHIDKN